MTEVYIACVKYNNDDYLDDYNTSVFTTEKKAIDFCINYIIKLEKYNDYIKDKNITNILSEDDYIKQLIVEIDTIDTLKKYCNTYTCDYKSQWDFYIIKKVIE